MILVKMKDTAEAYLGKVLGEWRLVATPLYGGLRCIECKSCCLFKLNAFIFFSLVLSMIGRSISDFGFNLICFLSVVFVLWERVGLAWVPVCFSVPHTLLSEFTPQIKSNLIISVYLLLPTWVKVTQEYKKLTRHLFNVRNVPYTCMKSTELSQAN